VHLSFLVVVIVLFLCANNTSPLTSLAVSGTTTMTVLVASSSTSASTISRTSSSAMKDTRSSNGWVQGINYTAVTDVCEIAAYPVIPTSYYQ
jgi:hypothetical protein